MFKIKKSTKMKKVFAAYAARKGVEANASKFFAICYYVMLYFMSVPYFQDIVHSP